MPEVLKDPELMNRKEDEDVALRALANKIVAQYNSVNMERFEMHAYGAHFDIVENDIRHLWKMFFSSDRIMESDRDIVRSLKSIPYTYWPKDIYLDASLAFSKLLGCPVATQVESGRLNPESRFLLNYTGDKTSQTGEDGVIHQILHIMGIKNSWCVEFGAWDGKHLSNSYDLVTKQGWNGVLIEARDVRFRELEETYKGNDRAYLFNQLIGFNQQADSIDFILGQTDIPQDPDLMVVDIDGNDWHVWHSMEAYRPRLMVVELNPTISNDVLYIQERDQDIQRGCSLRALIELGKSKGYELVCATSLNGLFVVSEEYEKFGIVDNSIDAMYKPIVDGHIFHGYDSSVHVVGMPELMWDWYGHGRDWHRDMPDRINVYKDF